MVETGDSIFADRLVLSCPPQNSRSLYTSHKTPTTTTLLLFVGFLSAYFFLSLPTPDSRELRLVQDMATAQLTASPISARRLPSFDGLRPSANNLSPAFENVRMGGLVANRPFRSLVVKAATVIAPKYSAVKPLGDRVLVKTKTAEEKTEGGILLPTTAQTKPQVGEVVAVGEGKTIGKTKIDICVKTGTQVVYSKYAGTELEFDGSRHLILKEDDIVGVLETYDVKDLKPLNDRVLIKVAEAEEKTAGGLLLTEATKEKPSIGTVIAVGPGPLDEEGNRKPILIPTDSSVMYSKYAGNDFKGKDGSEYIVLRISDVIAVLS